MPWESTAVFRALAIPGGELTAVAPCFPEYKPFAQQAVLVNSPNTPSGVVYTRQTLTALAGLPERKSLEYGHPICLISDEPYRELAYEEEVPFLPLIYPNTLVCCCVSYQKIADSLPVFQALLSEHNP